MPRRHETKDGFWTDAPSRCHDECGGTCDMNYHPSGVTVTTNAGTFETAGWFCAGCGHFYEEAGKRVREKATGSHPA